MAVLLPGEAGGLVSRDVGIVGFSPDQRELPVARWVFDHRAKAGRGTETLPSVAALLEQLLINLVETTTRHTRPGTLIGISAAADAGEVTITIADRGPGIPPGEEGHILERLQHASRSTTGRGIGLGLTVCKGIVAAHGGRI